MTDRKVTVNETDLRLATQCKRYRTALGVIADTTCCSSPKCMKPAHRMARFAHTVLLLDEEHR